MNVDESGFSSFTFITIGTDIGINARQLRFQNVRPMHHLELNRAEMSTQRGSVYTFKYGVSGFLR